MISSKHIQEVVSNSEPLTGIEAPSQTLALGEHQLHTSDTVIELSTDHVRQIGNIISTCLDEFPTEDTLVQSIIRRPTVIARVDCTISSNGILAYECEDRPAGLGVHHLLLDRQTGVGNIGAIQEHTQATLDRELVAVHHPDALPNDDGVVLPIINPADLNGHAVLVRGEPHMFADNALYEQLRVRSASTIRTEGFKGYLAAVPKLGGRLVKDAEELPNRDQSFVIKPLQGSKTQGIKIYLSKEAQARHGSKGIVSYSRAQRAVTEAGMVIVETLKPPIIVEGLGNMALRVAALVSHNEVKVIGGAYVIRSEMLVHGARNAVAGLVLTEEQK